MYIKLLGLMLVSSSLLLVNGCSQYSVTKPAVTKPATSAATKELNWKKRQSYLSGISSWKLLSKISLRIKDENLIFGLNWVQRPLNNYVMQVSNPLTGALVAKLARDARGVSLLSDNGRTYHDTDEERLLQSQSGLRIPVKGLQYWVRGITSPQYKVDQLVLDNAGRPQTIYQAGWKVSYSNYLNNSFNAAPQRVVLTRSKDQVYIKLIAKKWQGI